MRCHFCALFTKDSWTPSPSWPHALQSQQPGWRGLRGKEPTPAAKQSLQSTGSQGTKSLRQPCRLGSGAFTGEPCQGSRPTDTHCCLRDLTAENPAKPQNPDNINLCCGVICYEEIIELMPAVIINFCLSSLLSLLIHCCGPSVGLKNEPRGPQVSKLTRRD